MKISYNVTGAARKSLVGAISEELETPAKYLGAPTFAYEIGGYSIDKNGMVTGADNHELVSNLQGLHDLKAVEVEYDNPPLRDEEVPAFEDLEMTEDEELGLGRHRKDYAGENGMQASDVPEPDQLVIEVPLTGFTPEKLDNLFKLVNAKAQLIKAALGTADIPIQQTGDTLKFPWFSGDVSGDAVKAYAKFITALCDMAKSLQRVSTSVKTIENEKFAFRCFLLRLGFIGDEFKAERKILLSKLTGNSAFKNGNGKKEETEACTE